MDDAAEAAALVRRVECFGELFAVGDVGRGANCAAAPRSAATCLPSDEGRSINVTCAPESSSRRAVARPRPEAPPVIAVESPSSFMNQFFFPAG